KRLLTFSQAFPQDPQCLRLTASSAIPESPRLLRILRRYTASRSPGRIREALPAWRHLQRALAAWYAPMDRAVTPRRSPRATGRFLRPSSRRHTRLWHWDADLPGAIAFARWPQDPPLPPERD